MCLQLEDFWDALPEVEGGAYALLDNAILIVRDELETLDLKTTKIECSRNLVACKSHIEQPLNAAASK